MATAKGAGGINYSRMNSSHQARIGDSLAVVNNVPGAPGSGVSLQQDPHASRDQSQVQPQGPFYRQVTIEAAEQFAREENLIFIGETSCQDNINCANLFEMLIDKVHQTQTDLVRKGAKHINDLRYGEEERNVKYDRCCY